MYKWAMVIVLILASIVEALELPSEVDLRAAYCLRVVQYNLSVLKSAESSAQHQGIKETLAPVISTVDTNLRRLKQYLLPRIPYLDPDGLQAAVRRGEEDSVKDSEDTSCITKCNH